MKNSRNWGGALRAEAGVDAEALARATSDSSREMVSFSLRSSASSCMMRVWSEAFFCFSSSYSFWKLAPVEGGGTSIFLPQCTQNLAVGALALEQLPQTTILAQSGGGEKF